MNRFIPRFRLSAVLVATAIVAASCALPLCGWTSSEPLLVGLVMAAAVVAVFYVIGIGFAPRELFAMLLFWTAGLALRVIADCTPEENADEALYAIDSLNFFRYFCIFAVALSCITRCLRIRGSLWPFAATKTDETRRADRPLL